MHNKVNQIRFKNSILGSGLCDYSDAYTLVKGTITAVNTAAQIQPKNGANSTVIFKNCVWFNKHIQEDDAHDIHVVIPMYNLIDYKD